MRRRQILKSAIAAGTATTIGFTTSASADHGYTVEYVDDTTSVPYQWSDQAYRVYYPAEVSGETQLVHVSRGGNGSGDDRGELVSYVEAAVKHGYVVMQIDHRNAWFDTERIARFRGEEISYFAGEVADGNLIPSEFDGTVDGSKQGFLGHSGGCMEGLEAAGTNMTHGDYTVPEMEAVYGISPSGYDPDQFGIVQSPPGYEGIGSTATLVAIGEEEKDTNGPGTYMADDWRLQAYEAMDTDGPRWEAYIKGDNTTHKDMGGQNAEIKDYHIANSLEMWDTYLAGTSNGSNIGSLDTPANNTLELSTKG